MDPTIIRIVCALLALGIVIPLWWKIFAKAGFQGWWSLVLVFGMVFPLISIAVFLYFVFAEWPIQRQLRSLQGTDSAGRLNQDRPA